MDSKKRNDNNCNETNVRNVRELKNFFQNQNFPIMRLQNTNDNYLDTNSVDSSHSQTKCFNESIDRKEISKESSINRERVRPNRVIPRPPKQIQCPDINVSSLLKVLPTNQTQRPVPKPRRSLQLNKDLIKSDNNYKTVVNINTNCDNSVNEESLICDANQRSNSLTLSTIKEFNEMSLNCRTIKSHSIHSLPHNLLTNPVNEQKLSSESYNPNYNKICAQTIDQKLIHLNTESNSDKSFATNEKQNISKSKKHFKSFLKRSKLLSLRKKSTQKSQKTISEPLNAPQLRSLPVRPTRSPPLPPLLHFRPAAPLPPDVSEDYYEDTLSASNTNNDNSYSPYELYNDSEQIYCSVDNDEETESDFYEGIDDYDDGLTGDNKHSFQTDNYYEDSFDLMNSDCDRIYEVLPFEKDMENDSDSNCSAISIDEKPTNSESPFTRKRELKAVKLKKKFNLTGDEIPVNAGIVKEDNRGSRYDLFVRKGETVLILRMEGNPPGKWLAKNERAKVGFVDLANISFDAESVKCIIKTFVSNKP